MFDSLRFRLTLWYTGVLALVLVAFAVATYLYLARAERLRDDQSLADTANSLVSDFTTEMNEEQQTAVAAATEVTGTFQFKDRQALFLDGGRTMVSASTPPQVSPNHGAWPSVQSLSRNLAPLVDEAIKNGRGYATVSDQHEQFRAFATRVGDPGARYGLIIVYSLSEQERELAQLRRTFYVAVPLALFVAGLGGYFLARKTLAPVKSMGDQAARIGASNLNERLAVPDSRNELHRLARLFNEMLARLDSSFEQQKRFMADASHELRTPVAIVCGESEVALSQDERDARDYRESLAIINDEGKRLTRVVEDLFMLARADAGQYPLTLTEFYLDEVVGESVHSVRSLAQRRGLEMSYEPPTGEISYRGDEALLRRMILNLLDNAIKYTPPGGTINVAAQNGRECRIAITDSGPGIPIEARAHIFDRFYRVNRARRQDETTGGSGAGLGLPIAKWIAEVHGGNIQLDPATRSGATFIIHLPLF
jgi:heavy metal sensor kinase